MNALRESFKYPMLLLVHGAVDLQVLHLMNGGTLYTIQYIIHIRVMVEKQRNDKTHLVFVYRA